MRTEPRVFIASSLEAEPLAKAIQQNLTSAEVTLWSQDALRISHNVIDELIRNLQHFDFGVFVFAPDDIVTIRQRKQKAVRDNIVLELGMFIGRLGKERNFIVRPKGVDMRLPTDLLGIIAATYDRERATRDPAAALGGACTQIADAIKREHRNKSRQLGLLVTEALETICRLLGAPVTPEQASLRAFIFRKEGEELVCRYFWDPDYSEEQVGRTRFRIDEVTASKAVVVRCYLTNKPQRTEIDEIEGSSVSPLPKDFKGMKGKIKPTLEYVLAAPIRNEDDTIWGVVDFDASNRIGRRLLHKEKISNAIIRQLAKHLARYLAH